MNQSADQQGSVSMPKAGFGVVTPMRQVTRPAQTKLRRSVGILLDARVQEYWVFEALKSALAVPGVHLGAVVILQGVARPSVAEALHQMVEAFDRRLRCHRERLFSSVDVAAALAVPARNVDVVWDEGGWLLRENNVTTLRRFGVDLWLCVTAVPPRRPLPALGADGVWGIEIGGVPATNHWAGSGELGDRSPVTEVHLVNYASQEQGNPWRTHGSTVKNSLSNNRLHAINLGLDFYRRLLSGQSPAAEPLEELLNGGLNGGSPSVWPRLRTANVVRAARQVVKAVMVNRWHALSSREQWQIGYQFAETDFAEGGDIDPGKMHYLVPPKDRFWADPMAVAYEGRYFVFFEELVYHEQKGRIMVIELFEDRAPSEPCSVLERPYHLSYPFIFFWQGEIYLLPETAENRTVELYRCESFPVRWRLHKVLLRGLCAHDATLWEADGCWWMFASVAPGCSEDSVELHLYRSETPLGPWVPHQHNPLVSDARCARSAGPLFAQDGVLYRPSQDCSVAYGHSVVISRIDALNERDYHQVPVGRVLPGWKREILRVHTIGGAGRLRVLDYLVRRRRSPREWLQRANHKGATG